MKKKELENELKELKEENNHKLMWIVGLIILLIITTTLAITGSINEVALGNKLCGEISNEEFRMYEGIHKGEIKCSYIQNIKEEYVLIDVT